MQSQEDEPRVGPEPILDTAVRVAAFTVILISTFSILVMGISANSGAQTVMIVGLSAILGGPILLSLMIVARLACRLFASQDGQDHRRTAMLVRVTVYCVGVTALTFGAWQCVRLWTEASTYQEASIEAPHYSVPQF